MARGYGGWAPYVPVAERRRKAEREMAKLRKKGHPVAPVTLTGRTIAATFWGKSWCDNLESYQDYENRLPRGRTYVRNGSVVDLQIAPLEVKALVSGSSIYTVTVTIKAMAKTRWQALRQDCAGGIDSLVELLQGRFSKGVMERLCRQGAGLFPTPSEIRFSCSCPDGAVMCKHVAAALYGVGARLDEAPELLFRLRAVDHNELLASVDMGLPLAKTTPAAERILDVEDVSALFGLDMAEAEIPASAQGGEPPAMKPPPPTKPPRAARERKARTMAGGSSGDGACDQAKPNPAKRSSGASGAMAPAEAKPRPPRRKRNAIWDPADIT